MASIVLGTQSSFDESIFNVRPNILQVEMFSLTFKIFERARNHGKTFLKLCQTSFSGIVHQALGYQEMIYQEL